MKRNDTFTTIIFQNNIVWQTYFNNKLLYLYDNDKYKWNFKLKKKKLLFSVVIELYIKDEG